MRTTKPINLKQFMKPLERLSNIELTIDSIDDLADAVHTVSNVTFLALDSDGNDWHEDKDLDTLHGMHEYNAHLLLKQAVQQLRMASYLYNKEKRERAAKEEWAAKNRRTI
jgi:hypothetical protein